MVQIILQPDQFELLSELQAMFPDLSIVLHTEEGLHYTAFLCEEEAEGRQQRAFLEAHGIVYHDGGLRREEYIRGFFAEALLEERPIISLTFKYTSADFPLLRAVLRTKMDEVALDFPQTWAPFPLGQGHAYTGWLYVSTGLGAAYASLIGSDGRLTEIVHKAVTHRDMAVWLEDAGYRQIVCTSHIPTIAGLYKPEQPDN